jgi:hypothetical protein
MVAKNMDPIDYSNFLKVIGQNDRQGLFVLTKGMFVNSTGLEDSMFRCDSGGYGPQALLWQEDSEFPFGVDWIPTVSHLQTYEIVLDYSPYFYIIYIEVPEMKAISSATKFTFSDSKNETTKDTARLWCARTMQELLKNMLEWSSVYEEPFNNREIMAEYSKYSLELLDIPEDIVNEIKQLPDMHLYRYLKGDVFAQERPSNIPDMSEQFTLWLKSKIDTHRPKNMLDVF